MEKKNTLLLTVIAVATLLVAVVGATFAYFGSFQEEVTNTQQVAVNTTKGLATSLVVTGGETKIIVPDQKMAAGTGTERVEAAAGQGALTVTLNSGDAKVRTTCTYSIKLVPVGGYTALKTTYDSSLTKGDEFEYTLVDSGTDGKYTPGTKSDVFTETAKNFTAIDALADAAQIIVKDAKLVSEGTDSVATYTLGLKFYNIPSIHQESLENKLLGATLSMSAHDCTSESIA